MYAIFASLFASLSFVASGFAVYGATGSFGLSVAVMFFGLGLTNLAYYLKPPKF